MTITSPFQVGVQALYRRSILQGLGVVGASCLIGRQSFGASLTAPASVLTGLVVPQVRGPFQNNGATPWYASVAVGTPGQSLKIAIDTGSNFIWSTSSLCNTSRTGCIHYGNAEFIYQNSTSFTWVDQTKTPVNFGPWGTMIVETGQDLFQFSDGVSTQTTFYLAESYAGPQFRELDWDGGIGFPSGSQYVQPGISFVMADLMNAGVIDPQYPYLSFNWDPATRTGTCQIGGTDPSAYIATEGIRMPWQAYTEYEGVQYLWSTSLAEYSVGPFQSNDLMFCLDSGSSQFKGDNFIMNATLRCVKHVHVPVRLTVGTNVGSGTPGVIVVPPSVYNVPIEAGPGEGLTLPQFAPLNLKNLVLAGSVLMEHLYTVFEYSVAQGPEGFLLSPVAMYLYNKPNGPKLIQPDTAASASAAAAVTAGAAKAVQGQ